MPDNFSDEQIRGYASIGNSSYQEWGNYRLTKEVIALQKEVAELKEIIKTLLIKQTNK